MSRNQNQQSSWNLHHIPAPSEGRNQTRCPNKSQGHRIPCSTSQELAWRTERSLNKHYGAKTLYYRLLNSLLEMAPCPPPTSDYLLRDFLILTKVMGPGLQLEIHPRSPRIPVVTVTSLLSTRIIHS